GVKDGREVGGRATDNSEDLAGGRLRVQRRGQLAVARLELGEQPHVLNGNDRLVGEGVQQSDLPISEGLDLGPADYYHADRHPFVQQRGRQHGAKATTAPGELCLQARRYVLNMDCPAFDDGESSRIITADRASRVRQGNGPEPRDELQRVTLDVADYRVVC